MALELLVRITRRDGVVERYSLGGISGDTYLWEPRVLQFADIEREISIVPGEFRMSDLSLELDNSANYFSAFKNSHPLKNVQVELLLGDPSVGESDFTVIACQRIQSWSGRDVFSIDCTDILLRRFEQKVGTVISDALFPDLPDTTPRELVPFVIGEVSSEGKSNTGALPAYRIDPQVTAADFRYVAAVGNAGVDNVYVYEVLDNPADYSVTTAVYGGITFTVIDFTADPQDSSRLRELEVTWDSTSSYGGTAYTNPSLIWEQILLAEGFVAGEIDADEFDAVEVILDTRGIQAGFAAVDKDETLQDIAERWAESCNMTTFLTPAGKVAVTTPEPGATPSASLVEIDESQILMGSFQMAGPEDLASTIEYEFSRNWQTGEWDERVTNTDASQVSKIGEDIRRKVELWYVRHPSSAASVVQDKLFFMREERVICEFSVDPALIKSVSLGDDIRVTHYAGLGTNGFSEALFRVIGTGIRFDGVHFMGWLRVVDMSETNLTFTQEFRNYGEEALPILSDYNRIPDGIRKPTITGDIRPWPA